MLSSSESTNAQGRVLTDLFGEDTVDRALRRRRSSYGDLTASTCTPTAEGQKLDLAIGILRTMLNERKATPEDLRRAARLRRGSLQEESFFGIHENNETTGKEVEVNGIDKNGHANPDADAASGECSETSSMNEHSINTVKVKTMRKRMSRMFSRRHRTETSPDRLSSSK
uniref:Uncharacterized protein n=1 Tax=Pseudictyota dubia TaxID=2749911 RepID=A0A7R9ZF74_9STRA|mmetsp:Transcript_49394/g.91485  ORF Transcript_49394/g.91485 Transcript_49394/m.91485 type:complete len:170 (+) Transcript_49394:187-696(+)|eukprot:CAMPEP_0197438482 /NCGR_PEP_ID=MMETSP1175-20131217/5475_1 /TAXON_ID=1003142 /ORGANISM="Triceratium dubium, Strain CCMP147" /LENGTH=169 /DNA_ID=CAMNT_0042968227 /DNA_START=167 /DNA_END=676 /DNA_ORIENTATION=+